MPASSATRRSVNSPQRPRVLGARKARDNATVSLPREVRCCSSPPKVCCRWSSNSRIWASRRATASASGRVASSSWVWGDWVWGGSLCGRRRSHKADNAAPKAKANPPSKTNSTKYVSGMPVLIQCDTRRRA